MTVDEAKELLISGMNYAAYRETGTSLYDEDKDRLFGNKHYDSGRPVYSPSPWGEGAEFEKNMVQLLRWAIRLRSNEGDYDQAICLLKEHEHYITRIINQL